MSLEVDSVGSEELEVGLAEEFVGGTGSVTVTQVLEFDKILAVVLEQSWFPSECSSEMVNEFVNSERE